MRTMLIGMAAAAAAATMLGGCAVYPAGPAVAVEPAPVYVGPPAVVVSPRPYYYGYGGGYYGRGYRRW
jgi:hypothetical protein